MSDTYSCQDLNECPRVSVEIEAHSCIEAAEKLALQNRKLDGPTDFRVRVSNSQGRVVDIFLTVVMAPAVFVKNVELVCSGKYSEENE